jgi:uracil-DNA glycosylase
MRLDKDYLQEMELWSHVELRKARRIQDSAEPAAPTGASATVAASIPFAPPTIPRSAPPSATPSPKRPQIAAPATAKAPQVAVHDPARESRIAALSHAELATDAALCGACVLCKTRKQAVVGVGNIAAPWLFVGEAPGAEEDDIGEPFVGQAGKLLDAMLAAIGLQRGREVYIANVVKCRPPGNRTPTPEEASACAPYLDRQIQLIQPKIIVALGKTAATRLTQSDAAMGSLRGQSFSYQGIPVVVTYHPAYLLRNLPDKLKAWEDLQYALHVYATAQASGAAETT